MAVPEPPEEHDGGPPLFLRPEEIIHAELPSLRYLVRIRIIEFQDWHTPPPSSNDGFDGGGDSDSGDSNFNGYHPGFGGSCGGSRPRTTRYGGNDDPYLGRGSGPTFRPCGAQLAVLVGGSICPFEAPRGARTCRKQKCRTPSPEKTGGVVSLLGQVDFGTWRCSLSPVISAGADPMLVEARLCTPQKAGKVSWGAVHSPDCYLHTCRTSWGSRTGFVGSCLMEEPDLLMG